MTLGMSYEVFCALRAQPARRLGRSMCPFPIMYGTLFMMGWRLHAVARRALRGDFLLPGSGQCACRRWSISLLLHLLLLSRRHGAGDGGGPAGSTRRWSWGYAEVSVNSPGRHPDLPVQIGDWSRPAYGALHPGASPRFSDAILCIRGGLTGDRRKRMSSKTEELPAEAACGRPSL